jgi:peptidoglycan/xylan/chitin deacetylase (PgdA/CDA1 family)
VSGYFRILLYHRIGLRDGSFMDRYTVSPATFAAQMRQLAEGGWHVLPLAEAVSGQSCEQKQPRVVLTFDDAFASNREFAWPVLRELGMPAATFVVTDCFGRVNQWDGPERANYPLLSESECRAADGPLLSFHPHSRTHADLCRLVHDAAALDGEIAGSLHAVRRLSRAEAFYFAYPRGAWNWTVVEAVRRSGCAGGCTCLEGLNSPATNPYLLRRVEIFERDRGWRFRQKLCFGRDLLAWPPRKPAGLAVLAAQLRHRLQRTHAGRAP